MTQTIIVDSRFNGPPDSGNGGYVCGLVANHIDGVAEVTLRAPPPLERPLALEAVGNGRVVLRDGETLVAEGRPAALDIEAPPPPSLDSAEAAVAGYSGFKRHVFPTCFVCGPQRKEKDGLRIFAGPLPDNGMVASPWTPDAWLGDDNDLVRPEFCWAVLDCPGYFALHGEEGPTAVLGRMTAEIYRPVAIGAKCVVIAWSLGGEGRKHYAGTAIFGPSGRLCAAAKQTWIELPGPIAR